MLSSQQLRCIISIFVNIALILLPLYAADYPSVDKNDYFKLLSQWSKRSQQVINHYITEFKGGQFSEAVSGRISVMQFVEKAKKLEIFNVLQIREVAKKTMLISDHNPEINRDALLNKGLFTDRLSSQPLNHEEEAVMDAMNNLP